MKPIPPERLSIENSLQNTTHLEASAVSPVATAFDDERLRDLRAANARLRALVDIGLELVSERDSTRLLQNVAVAARDLFAATYVTLGIVDRRHSTVERIVIHGLDTGTWIKAGDAIPGMPKRVVAGRRVLRGKTPDGRPESLGLPVGHPPIREYLIAPIASLVHVYGWVCLVSNEGRAFTDDDEVLLVGLSGQVGRIYENGYFYFTDGRPAATLSSGADITERIRAEAQATLQTAALTAAANAIVITDAVGTIEWVNPAFSEITGYSTVEAVGKNPRDLVKSDQHDPAFYKSMWETILSGRVWHGEVVNRRKDGTLYAEEQSITPVRGNGGAIEHFIAIKQDVSLRKRHEEELQERARISGLIAGVGLALNREATLAEALQRCAEALVTHLGAAFARIWTLNDEHILELHASAGLYTHLNGAHSRVPIGQFKIGRIADCRKPHLTNSVLGDPEVSDQDWAQREGMVAFAGHPLIVGDHLVGVMAIFARHALSESVLTSLASVADHIALGIERHRTAQALRDAEERMRFALENARVGIWDVDYATGVVRWSEILERHSGLAPGTFGGTFEAFMDAVHADDRDRIRTEIDRAAKAGSDFILPDFRVVWPDQTVHWLSGAGRVVVGSDGEPVRGVGIALDVSGRRKLEEQYHQAQKMEAVGRLAGGVAHDFNNLLTAILGYCELLLDDASETHAIRSDILEIQKAGERAAGLTRQLLAFSRKQIIEPTILDLNAVALDLKSMLARLIGEDIDIRLTLASGLGRVKTDRGQIEQVLLNLAVNARDAMPKGGTLTIETANVELDDNYTSKHFTAKIGPHVVLTVTDTGTGMTREVQERLFEPFFTTKGVGKGTGLGLATVHGIVSQAGGNIRVYSEVGLGTTFEVYLPRTDAESSVAPFLPSATPAHRGTQTVLVVEDARQLRELTERLLIRQGYTVLTAADASEAARLFEQNASIDVLLTDVVMPGSSGPELTGRLLERRPGLKVIYMSGYTEDAIIQHGVLNADVAFLHKPFTSEALGRKLREVLDE